MRGARPSFVWVASLVLAAAAPLATGGAAFAHGGNYQPPPEDGGPGSPPPPPGGGPTTGGGDGGPPPTTGGGDVGGPTTGGGDRGKGPTTGGGFGGGPTTGPGTGGGGGAPPGPTTGGGGGGGAPPTTGGTFPPVRRAASAKGPDLDHWTRWWYANRATLLALDTNVASNSPTTHGGPADSGLWRVEAQSILTRALSDRDEDVSSGAAVALGKSGDAADAPALTALLLDAKRQQPVREAAALGLALLGRGEHPSSPAATKALESVVGRDSEPERLRAVCAWSLGLRRDLSAVPFLLDLVTAKAPSWDVPAAATSALGLSQCELAREPLLAWLDGTPGRRKHETMRRVHAAHALAALGDPSVVPALREVLRDDDEDVRRAAVLALGALAQPEDETTAQLLVRTIDRDRDRGVRNMAALALGRAAPKQAERALRFAYTKGENLHQPFAALGLGLLARTTGDASILHDLRKDLADRANADFRGAVAIALGIGRDRAAAKILREIVADRGDPELRAHAALALGMIGDAASADLLRELLGDARDPSLQREVAMALGLLGDVKSVKLLLGMVKDGSSLYVQGAAAMALGRIGGADGAKALGALVADDSRPGLVRGLAAVGMGFALDRDAGRGLGRVSADLDWYVQTPSVEEILTIL